MDEVTLENWSLVGSDNPYLSPELRVCRLSGNVYGHPKYINGDKVVTSAIMHADGRSVLTLNRKYVLGKINQEYKDWYETNYPGKSINEDDPFPERK